MRGFSRGGGGAAVMNMILKIAPIGFSFFAVLFLGIALSAGSKPNYLEDVNIISFNMSTLGQNLVKPPDIAAAAQGACSQAGNAVSSAANAVGNAAGTAVDATTNVANDVANGAGNAVNAVGNVVGGLFGRASPGSAVSGAISGAGSAVGGATKDACNAGAQVANQAVHLTADAINKALGSVAKALGIRESYSVHIGSLCEGDFKPRFSDPGARPDVASCTPKFAVNKTDLSGTLDNELQVGPFKFRLSDLGLVEDLQKALDLIPRALAAMAFFFLFSLLALAGGLALALAALALEYRLQRLQRFALLGGAALLGLGCLTLLVGAVGVTVTAEKIKKAVNDHGAKFGIAAATSPAMYFLLWAALVCASVALLMLLFVWWRARRRGGLGGGGMAGQGGYGEKNMSDGSVADQHGFFNEPVNGGPGEFGAPPPPPPPRQGGF